jgi:hypothetical protein
MLALSSLLKYFIILQRLFEKYLRKCFGVLNLQGYYKRDHHQALPL